MAIEVAMTHALLRSCGQQRPRECGADQHYQCDCCQVQREVDHRHVERMEELQYAG